jgi:hypothetical protein
MTSCKDTSDVVKLCAHAIMIRKGRPCSGGGLVYRRTSAPYCKNHNPAAYYWQGGHLPVAESSTHATASHQLIPAGYPMPTPAPGHIGVRSYGHGAPPYLPQGLVRSTSHAPPIIPRNPAPAGNLSLAWPSNPRQHYARGPEYG